jgi:hypothetical protein
MLFSENLIQKFCHSLTYYLINVSYSPMILLRLSLAPAEVPQCFKGKLSAEQTDEVL